MQVLMVTMDYPPLALGGIGYHTEKIVKALAKLGVDVTVLTSITEKQKRIKYDEPTSKVIRVEDVQPLQYFPNTFVARNVALTIEIFRLMETNQFDIIHCQDVFPSLVTHIAAQKYHVPLIQTKHSVLSTRKEFHQLQDKMILEAAQAAQRKPSLAYNIRSELLELEEASLIWAEHIICVSQFVKDSIKQLNLNVEDKCVVLPNGTDIWQYASLNTTISWQSGNKDTHEWIMLLVGRVTWIKGGDIALKALALLRDIPLKLVIVGTGFYESTMMNMAEDLKVSDRVRFEGYIEGPKLADFYRASDMILVPSRIEDFPLVVLEAMSLGKTVIAARTGGIPEQIQHGTNGLLFEPENEFELADCIRWVIENNTEAKKLGEVAKEGVFADYSWERIAQKTLNQYEVVISKSRIDKTMT